MSDDSEDDEYDGFVKMLPNPILPTQAMIDCHMVTHTPYANWCPNCVRGRGAMYAHRVIKERDDQVPVICGDYIIAEEYMAILVMIDRRSKWIWAHVVPNKGALKHWFPLSAVVRDIDLTGYKRIVMKSDQENAIADLFRKYKDSQDRVEVMIEHSPIGDSQANGDAERAVRSVQGLGRTLKDALEVAIGAEVPASHDIMTWLIEHVSNILNLYKRTAGGDGLTAYYRLRGRPWRIPIPEFGETVEYRRKGKTNKFARNNFTGVYIGINLNVRARGLGCE